MDNKNNPDRDKMLDDILNGIEKENRTADSVRRNRGNNR